MGLAAAAHAAIHSQAPNMSQWCIVRLIIIIRSVIHRSAPELNFLLCAIVSIGRINMAYTTALSSDLGYDYCKELNEESNRVASG